MAPKNLLEILHFFTNNYHDPPSYLQFQVFIHDTPEMYYLDQDKLQDMYDFILELKKSIIHVTIHQSSTNNFDILVTRDNNKSGIHHDIYYFIRLVYFYNPDKYTRIFKIFVLDFHVDLQNYLMNLLNTYITTPKKYKENIEKHIIMCLDYNADINIKNNYKHKKMSALEYASFLDKKHHTNILDILSDNNILVKDPGYE